jgi:hypothetical protein
MAKGLQLKDVRRFGTKLSKGVSTIGRKVAKTAEGIGSVVVPIASAVNPALGAELEAGLGAISKIGRKAGSVAERASSRAEQAFRTVQQPALGAREIGRAIGTKMAPEERKVVIGDVVMNRLKKRQGGIQREGGNDWAPDLPFAGM